MSVFARLQAALLGVIVFVNFLQVGVDIGERRNARRAALNAVVSELMTFVANAHGARFIEPVHADLLGDKAFGRKLASGDEEYDETEEAADFGATMVSLGMTDEDEDVYAASESAMTDGIVGFYDSEADRLYVRGKRVTPYTRLVLVHELAHAWQDQWYDLEKVQDIEDSDAWTAAHALVEGDAMRIETMYRDTLSAADQALIDRIEGGGDPERMSRAEVSLAIMYDFPYVAGEEFATTLHERGGNEAIARAFGAPPASTEQVLHPEKYLAGEKPEFVGAPDAGGQIVDTGTFGELGLLMLVMQGEWDKGAFRSVSGWAGDRYVTWESSTRTCTQARVQMESRASRDRLLKALRAKASGDYDIAPNGPVGADLRYCAS